MTLYVAGDKTIEKAVTLPFDYERLPVNRKKDAVLDCQEIANGRRFWIDATPLPQDASKKTSARIITHAELESVLLLPS